jgi:glyoxylase-like metal-dependent hydrolase (beta-lactamase superfamily II)
MAFEFFRRSDYEWKIPVMIASLQSIPLEDELGDVLDKAMSCAGLTVEALGARAGVPPARIHDAIDYRPELGPEELSRLAAALGLNEVGLCALGLGKYPRPEIGALPFCLWPLRMAYGIGWVNAYLVAESGGDRGVLFDTGPGLTALRANWPESVREVEGVFLTHVEAEHAGGLCEVVAHFGVASAFIPTGARSPCGRPLAEAETVRFGSIEVTAFSTPGHAPAHNCYRVRSTAAPAGRTLLISGDLVFAGSAGGPYFCQRQLRMHLRRVLTAVPPETLVAPGHGPLTTAENELRYNPFLL